MIRLTVVKGSLGSERSSFLSNSSDSRFSTVSWSTINTSLSDPSSLSQPQAVHTAIDKSGFGAIGHDSIVQDGHKIPLDVNKPQPPLPQDLADSTVAAQDRHPSKRGSRHGRWCTTREHKTVYTTYGGFAKHEKEHDSCYVFLPWGPIERTPWGSQCALCEERDPSKVHLQDHNILQYDGQLGKPDTRSRKSKFEELLKKHKASEEKIKVLVNNWRDIRHKKAYSCGFCISIFETLPERTYHIDREHYAKGKHIDEWEDTLVIKGLLLQREVKQECLRLFNPVDPTAVAARISWPPSAIDELRLRLETGEENAKDLATDVFRLASNRGATLSSRTTGASILGPSAETSGMIHSSSSAQAPMNLEKGSASCSYHLPNRDHSFSKDPQARYQNYGNDQNTLDISLMSVSSPSCDPVPLETSSGFPTRSTSLASNTTSNPDFMYIASEIAYGAAQIPLPSQFPHSDPLSYRLDRTGVSGSNSHEHSHFVDSLPEIDTCQISFVDASASEGITNTASPLYSSQQNAYHASTGPPIKFQAPKRKLSDKSANEANLIAQTQAPVSTHNQMYPTFGCGMGRSNAPAYRNSH